MYRWPFFIACDDKADGARIGRDVVQSSNKCRNAALHINRAAPVQKVTFDFGSKGITCPAIAGWNDVNMAGESKVTPGRLPDREQIFDRRAMRGVVVIFARYKAFDGKTQRNKHIFKRVENGASCRSDALASDQALGVGKCNGIGHRPKALRIITPRNKSDVSFTQSLFCKRRVALNCANDGHTAIRLAATYEQDKLVASASELA